jgi:hypothetical protein
MQRPGRVCPLHYRYTPAAFARDPELQCDTLFVVGGLYGNRPALDALQGLLEPGASLVFNGDFNWFNIDPDGFESINAGVLRHFALRGNVETELRDRGDEAGCGCAYPQSVDDLLVERSNTIMKRLKQTGALFPGLVQRLTGLPMHAVAQVGDARVGIVHGDAWSLAGWEFAHDRLHEPDRGVSMQAVFADADIDIFASSHTCLPALRTLAHGGKQRAVINNGAAGMPNFAATRFGVITRISVRPCPRPVRLYGTQIGKVHVDAIQLRYDHPRFVREFLSNWPAGSPGHASYHSRIIHGPAHSPELALGAYPGTPSGYMPAESGPARERLHP